MLHSIKGNRRGKRKKHQEKKECPKSSLTCSEFQSGQLLKQLLPLGFFIPVKVVLKLFIAASAEAPGGRVQKGTSHYLLDTL